MPVSDIAGRTAVVTGASRGFGRAIAAALIQAGARVAGVARDAGQLQRAGAELGGSFIPVPADAAGPATAGQVIDACRPSILVLNAGATPPLRPLHQHTWQSFSQNWETDVQHVFRWVREALLRPLDPGSTVVTVSSGAALRGSPLSGGYAGAKAAIRFLTGYAADEAERAGLDLRFRCLLPRLTPVTELGSAAVAGYAARAGLDAAGYLAAAGPVLTAGQVGSAVSALITDPAHDQGAYLLTPDGLTPVP